MGYRAAWAGHSLSCKKPLRFITQTQERVQLLAADQRRVIIAMICLYLPLKGIPSPSSGSFNKWRWGRAWELGVVGLTSKWKLQAGIRKKNKEVWGGS